MRRILVPFAFVLATFPWNASADPLPDWLVATFTAGPGGATDAVVEVRLFVGFIEEPVAHGFAASYTDEMWTAYVSPFGDRRARVSTSNGLGSYHHNVELPLPAFDGFSMGSVGHYPDLAPGDSVSVLHFFPGGAIEDWSTDADTSAGTVDVSVATGSGSTAIPLVAGADGYGAHAVAAGVAATSASRVSATAIVGAAETSQCAAGFCSGSAVDPTGRTFGWSATAAVAVGVSDPSFFSGEAGDWRWEWRGAFRSFSPVRPIMAAYAPVGPLASRFLVR